MSEHEELQLKMAVVQYRQMQIQQYLNYQTLDDDRYLNIQQPQQESRQDTTRYSFDDSSKRKRVSIKIH